MAAYAVSARIAPSRPHAAPPPASLVVVRGRGAIGGDIVDTSRPGQRDLELRWEAIRERWSQLTFFLCDPESWR